MHACKTWGCCPTQNMIAYDCPNNEPNQGLKGNTYSSHLETPAVPCNKIAGVMGIAQR